MAEENYVSKTMQEALDIISEFSDRSLRAFEIDFDKDEITTSLMLEPDVVADLIESAGEIIVNEDPIVAHMQLWSQKQTPSDVRRSGSLIDILIPPMV